RLHIRFVRPGWSTIYESLGSVVILVVSASVASCTGTARSGGPQLGQAGSASRHVVLRGKWTCRLLLRPCSDGAGQRTWASACSDFLSRWANYGALERLATEFPLRYSLLSHE